MTVGVGKKIFLRRGMSFVEEKKALDEGKMLFVVAKTFCCLPVSCRVVCYLLH